MRLAAGSKARLLAMILAALALPAAAAASQPQRATVDHGFTIAPVPPGAVASKYRRQIVDYATPHPAGTIVVDPGKRFLYVVQGRGKAVRYGISVGAAAFSWSGEATVGRKAVWPRWTPTPDMIARDPTMARHRDGVAAGPTNPMGARALYLYRNGRDTLYRLHGTSEYWSIGKAASSGCIRLLNSDIIALYDSIPVGAKAVVLPAGPPLKWRVQSR